MSAQRGNPSWRPAAPKLWRIRGEAHDGMVVTLGRYETESEAQLDLERLTKFGGYRNLAVEALPPPPPQPSPSSPRPPSSPSSSSPPSSPPPSSSPS